MLTDEIRARLFLLIKQRIKGQKLSYLKIADRLNMSESGLKRIFQEKNCSLDKLIHICEVLSLDFKMLLELWDTGLVKRKIAVSIELDHFLAENLHLFSLLRLAQLTKLTTEAYSQRGFSEDDISKLNATLRAHGILRKAMDLQGMHRICLQFPRESKVITALAKNWGIDFATRIVNKQVSHASHYIWAQELKQEDAQQMLKEMRQVFQKYEGISAIYRGTERDPQPEFSVFICSGFETPGLPTES